VEHSVVPLVGISARRSPPRSSSAEVVGVEGFPSLRQWPGFLIAFLIAWVIVVSLGARIPALAQIEQGF
jgi:hypothetical protein